MTANNGFGLKRMVKWAVPPITSAVLLAAAFPPFDWPLLAWIALVPLFLKLYRCRILTGFGAGLFTGLIFYVILMWWTASLGEISLVNFLLMGIVLGSFFGLFAGLGCWLLRILPQWAPLYLPPLWVSIEYFRSHIGFLSQPFGILGYSQFTILPVAGLASYTGVYGVSSILIASNALIVSVVWRCSPSPLCNNSLRQGRWQPLAPVLIAASILLGGFTLQAIDGEASSPAKKLSVAIVQGNAVANGDIDDAHYLKDVLPIYEKLTREARGASLVVWPSSSVPGVIPYDRSMTDRLGLLAKEGNTFLLIGAAGFDKFDPKQRLTKRVANSAFLFSPSGLLRGRYDKIRLLPFDEYLPARDLIPWPDWVVSKEMKDHQPGKDLTVFQAGPANFGVQICFENMFPDQVRQLALKGVDFVVGQTNEAYTESPAAHYQHLMYFVFRAIENHMPILRSSTNGVSAIIDATGRIVGSVQDASGREIGVTGMITGNIKIGQERSFYTRHGNAFVHACVITVTVLILIGIITQVGRALLNQLKNSGG